MCGRFALRLACADIRNIPGHDGVEVDDWIDEDAFVPRYNIAPRSQAPVLRRGGGAVPSYRLHTMKWGLVPHWSKHEDKTLSTTNARAENLVEGGGMWASIKGKNRCAIVAQGYYEWLTKGKDKLPHFIKPRDGGVMLMAGLYDSVVLEGQITPLWTFSIVTTSAAQDISWLHDRQPVILSTRAALDAWLDTDTTQSWTPALTQLVQPYSDSAHPLECYRVPKEVGKVGTESSTFIEPIATRKDGIQAMFSKQVAKSKSQPSSSTTSTPHTSMRTPSPIKRSRTPIAVLDLTSSPPRKKTKMEIMEDSDIELIDSPKTPQKASHLLLFVNLSFNAHQAKPKPKLTPSPRKSPAKRKQSKGGRTNAGPSNAKLEAFFNRIA